MNCPKCGFANSPYDKVCRDCGEPLVNNESNNIFGDDILKPITVNNLEDIDNNLNEEEVNQVVESNDQ